LILEAGTRKPGCPTIRAFRMRANMSAIGSDIVIG
jgi:hypothetical protein